MIRAYAAASAAIDQQLRRFERSAARVASAPAPDYVREAVEQIGARHAVTVNVSVLRAADEMTGTLFSIFA